MNMAARSSIPVPLLVLVGAVLLVLLVASAATGQWAILVLGTVAVAAMALPFRNRR